MKLEWEISEEELERKTLNAYDESWIERKIKDNPRISISNLANEVETYVERGTIRIIIINPVAIRRVLRRQN